jgi:hydrogenase maturation protease
MPIKTVTVIGLGNEIVSDDGIGIYAVRSLKTKLSTFEENFRADVTLHELSTGGFQLLDYMIGCGTCIIIDAAMTGINPPGTIFKKVYSTMERPAKPVTSHQINLSELLGLAEMLKADIPSTTIIYGIEAGNVTTFSTKCTDEVQKALPRLVDLVFEDILRYTHCKPVTSRLHTAGLQQSIPTDETRICQM